MLSFNRFLIETKNVHMRHIDENVFDGGVNGVRDAINLLQTIRDTLAGNAKKKVDITLKVDGCVHEDTLILTNKGNIPIKDIVHNIDNIRENLKIYGKDFEEKIPYSKAGVLLDVACSDGDKSWVEICLENGSSIKLTEDHEVHTQRGWVQAKDLLEGDDITEI